MKRALRIDADYSEKTSRRRSALDGWAKQLFQCLDVFGEGSAAGFGDAIQGFRLAQHELLFYRSASFLTGKGRR